MRTILVSAYACEPLKGSEQGVGWNWVLQMAKNNYLHVITRSNNKEHIEAHLPIDIASNIQFHYYDTPSFFRKFKKRSKGLYFYYLCWQIGIISIIRNLKRTHKFNYSLHLTFGNIWLPTFLPFFSIPFIWGPLGGGEAIPNSFIKVLPVKQRLVQTLRVILAKTVYINPLLLTSAFRSKAILCRTQSTVDVLPEIFRSKTKTVADGAIEPEIFKFQASAKHSETVRLISTSRLIAFKNVFSLVQALLYIPSNYNFRLTIIGSGPERVRIQQFLDEYSLNYRVSIIDELSRQEVLEELSESNIFISPSLRDACNLSLLEAMAVGLPIICLNWSGMAISTTDDCAIRLPVSSPEQMPQDLASAICRLIDNPYLRSKMGEAGRARIQTTFNWESKGIFMDNLLDELDKNA